MLRSVYVALAACALSVTLSACGSDSDEAPVAADITINAVEDTTSTFSLSDLDPNGDNLTATVETAPTRGEVVIAGGTTLTFTYVPHPNEYGADFFTYRVSDGKNTSNLGHVLIGINPVDDLPVIEPTLAVDQDSSVTAVLITDIEGDAFTSQIVTPPSQGTLTVDPENPGKFTYVPNAGFSGTDSVELSATYVDAADTTVPTATGTVTITVRPTP